MLSHLAGNFHQVTVMYSLNIFFLSRRSKSEKCRQRWRDKPARMTRFLGLKSRTKRRPHLRLKRWKNDNQYPHLHLFIHLQGNSLNENRKNLHEDRCPRGLYLKLCFVLTKVIPAPVRFVNAISSLRQFGYL